MRVRLLTCLLLPVLAACGSEPLTPEGQAAKDACDNVRSMHRAEYVTTVSSSALISDVSHVMRFGTRAMMDEQYSDLGQSMMLWAQRVIEGAERGNATYTTYTIMGDSPAFTVMDSLISLCDDTGF